jgi:hypothetical protein
VAGIKVRFLRLLRILHWNLLAWEEQLPAQGTTPLPTPPHPISVLHLEDLRAHSSSSEGHLPTVQGCPFSIPPADEHSREAWAGPGNRLRALDTELQHPGYSQSGLKWQGMGLEQHLPWPCRLLPLEGEAPGKPAWVLKGDARRVPRAQV